MPRRADGVERFMAALDHPLKEVIAAIRAIVLRADPQLGEQIKWNAPSFGHAGDDRLTLRLHPPDRVQIVFHRGTKVKESTGFAFADDSGLLHWVAADRAVATFRTLDEVRASEAALVEVVARWVRVTA